MNATADTELTSRTSRAVSELVAKYGQETDARARRLLAIAWLEGYAAGLETMHNVADRVLRELQEGQAPRGEAS